MVVEPSYNCRSIWYLRIRIWFQIENSTCLISKPLFYVDAHIWKVTATLVVKIMKATIIPSRHKMFTMYFIFLYIYTYMPSIYTSPGGWVFRFVRDWQGGRPSQGLHADWSSLPMIFSSVRGNIDTMWQTNIAWDMRCFWPTLPLKYNGFEKDSATCMFLRA
jgi:hypothetical protein